MCYTGTCPYEYKGGEGAGECSLRDKEPVPSDAECVLMEKRIDEYEKEHPISTIYQRVKWDVLRLQGQDEILF